MPQPSTRPALYKGYRFPPEIISCVWFYFRFGVSLRDVSESMLARGIQVSHEAIRAWTVRFGMEYARRLRQTRGVCSNTWHLDELCLVINGTRGSLWRAVDDAGAVLDILVQRRRNAVAAKRFFRKLLKGLRMVPRAIVTDRLASYAAARAEVMPAVAHRRGWRENNRVENSHQPVRRRERGLQRFKRLRHAARFCSVFSVVSATSFAWPPRVVGQQLPHRNAPALAGMGRRVGVDDIRPRGMTPSMTRRSVIQTLSSAKHSNTAANLTTPRRELALEVQNVLGHSWDNLVDTNFV